jgi:hypothetical protein
MLSFSEVIINRSFSSRAWPVKILIPNEHTFSDVVRSADSGSSNVETWSGIATSIRFSSLPDPKGIGTITFQPEYAGGHRAAGQSQTFAGINLNSRAHHSLIPIPILRHGCFLAASPARVLIHAVSASLRHDHLATTVLRLT